MLIIDTKRIATIGLLLILTLVILFHLLVVTGVVPFQIVWGGRLKDTSQMLVFETLSILLNLLMLLVVAIQASLVKVSLNRMTLKIAFWLMGLLFFINTIGNLVSLNSLEQVVFTPVTLLLALFSFRLAISRSHPGKTHAQKTLT
jgi:hypothetical protein